MHYSGDGCRPMRVDKGWRGVTQVADDQDRVAKTSAQGIFVHAEETGLPVVWKIPIINRYRKPLPRIEPIDLDTNANLSRHFVRVPLQREEAIASSDTELDHANLSVTEPIGKHCRVVQTVPIIRAIERTEHDAIREIAES
jgi:hypothetical protein